MEHLHSENESEHYYSGNNSYNHDSDDSETNYDFNENGMSKKVSSSSKLKKCKDDLKNCRSGKIKSKSGRNRKAGRWAKCMGIEMKKHLKGKMKNLTKTERKTLFKKSSRMSVDKCRSKLGIKKRR